MVIDTWHSNVPPRARAIRRAEQHKPNNKNVTQHIALSLVYGVRAGAYLDTFVEWLNQKRAIHANIRHTCIFKINFERFNSDPQTGVGQWRALTCNLRSEYRCSMCPAIHTNSHSLLRPSSTSEPSDPPPRIYFFNFYFKSHIIRNGHINVHVWKW